VKSELTRFLEHATATKLTGPWTFIGKDDWAGWGSGMEGPSIVRLDDGTWRMFMDPQQAGFAYTDSKDLMTWSKRTPPPGAGGVLRHGTVIRDEALSIGQGGTSATGGAGGGGGSNPEGGALASGGGPTAGASGSISTAAGGGGLSGVAGSVVGTAGSLSTGGLVGVGGNAGSAPVDSTTVSPSADSAGCSCKTSAPSPLSSQSWLGGLFAAAALVLRRRYLQPSRIAPMA
jgi:MYXO-CTERM domain-containing protein